MKKLNKGFTLAEVLITLTIIGIVAALVMPALMSNTDKSAWASGLATTVGNLNRGFAQMLAVEGTDTLESTTLWADYVGSKTIRTGDNNIRHELNKYFKIGDMINNVPPNVKVMNLNNTASDALNNTVRFVLANNTTMNIILRPVTYGTNGSDCTKVEENGGVLCERVADIYIDANGDKKPNVIGKDIYLFYLSNQGQLFPYGGKDTNIYDTSVKLYSDENGCSGKNSGEIKDALTCAGRVVADGYRINY